MEFADKNLLDAVVEAKSAILVTESQQNTSQLRNDDSISCGVITVNVLRELTPGFWHGTREFDLRFAQYKSRQIRIREGGLGWNGVDLQATRFLLVALPPDIAQKAPLLPLTAIAVAPLQSPQDDLVRSIEKILVVESTKELSLRSSLIAEGLTGPLEFFSDYCHYALGRLARIPRAKAVEMELGVLEDTHLTSQQRVMAEANLELELWKTKDPEDLLNKRILAGFFRALQTSDPELRRLLLLAIYGKLCPIFPEGEGPAQSYREKLMQGVQLPSKESIRRALQELDANRDLVQEVSWIEEYISHL